MDLIIKLGYVSRVKLAAESCTPEDLCRKVLEIDFNVYQRIKDLGYTDTASKCGSIITMKPRCSKKL
jgi:hypothetical protein